MSGAESGYREGFALHFPDSLFVRGSHATLHKSRRPSCFSFAEGSKVAQEPQRGVWLATVF